MDELLPEPLAQRRPSVRTRARYALLMMRWGFGTRCAAPPGQYDLAAFAFPSLCAQPPAPLPGLFPSDRYAQACDVTSRRAQPTARASAAARENGRERPAKMGGAADVRRRRRVYLSVMKERDRGTPISSRTTPSSSRIVSTLFCGNAL